MVTHISESTTDVFESSKGLMELLQKQIILDMYVCIY